MKEDKMQMRASHILVETQQQAQNLLEQISSGADFGQLAQMHSRCPSGRSGGDLGQFTSGQMVKPFEDAVMATDINQISAPVQTQFGWHLIKRTA